MAPEVRTTAPAHATGAVEFVPLDDIADDARFRLRDEGDVSALATSIGRLGQLTPIEIRPSPLGGGDGRRWQVVAGFRRIAALRLLHRERVLARLHERLDDDDAWALALTQALLTEPLTESDIDAIRAKVDELGTAPWAPELLDEALVRAPVPPELRDRLYELLRGAPPAAVQPSAGGGAGDARDEMEAPGPLLAAPGERPPAPEGPGDEASEVAVTPEELADDLALRLNALCQDLALAFECWGDLPEDSRRRIVEQARYIAELFPFLEVPPR